MTLVDRLRGVLDLPPFVLSQLNAQRTDRAHRVCIAQSRRSVIPAIRGYPVKGNMVAILIEHGQTLYRGQIVLLGGLMEPEQHDGRVVIRQLVLGQLELSDGIARVGLLDGLHGRGQEDALHGFRFIHGTGEQEEQETGP